MADDHEDDDDEDQTKQAGQSNVEGAGQADLQVKHELVGASPLAASLKTRPHTLLRTRHCIPRGLLLGSGAPRGVVSTKFGLGIASFTSMVPW